jgi:O-antigen/teichoic acid export membrane protein
MLKELLKEGGLYTIANLLTKGVSLMLIPFYINYFTEEEYGIRGMLSVFGSLIGAVVSFQLYQGMGRFIAEDVSLSKKQKIGSTAIIFTIIIYSLFLISSFLFKDFFIDMLSSDVRIKDEYFLLATSAVCINSIFMVLGTQLKSLRKVNEFALTSFLHSIINVLMILIFVMKFDLGLSSIYIAGLVIAPIIILLQAYYLKDYLIFYFSFKELKRLLKFSTPLIPAAIAYLLLNLTDRFFIKEISMRANGIYEVAFSFTSVVSIVLVAFQSALAPILYQKHQLESTKTELANVFKLFFGLGTLGVLILSLFSYETLFVFTKPSYYEAEYVMPFLYVSLLITGLGMFSPGLHIKQKTKIIPAVVLFSAAINIGLNYLFVSRFQLVGAAVATLISMFINSIILFLVSQKLYKTPYDLKLVIPLFILFTALIGVGYYLKIFDEISMLNAILIKLAIVIGYGLVLWKFGLIDISKLKRKNA